MTTMIMTVGLAALVALAVSALTGVLLLRRLRHSQAEYDRALQAIHNDLRGLTAGAAGMGKRLVRVEQTTRQLTDRQDQLALRDSGTQPYAQAIRLVEQGAGVADLVSSCGLTEGEAELVVMLHGARTAAKGQERGYPTKVVG